MAKTGSASYLYKRGFQGMDIFVVTPRVSLPPVQNSTADEENLLPNPAGEGQKPGVHPSSGGSWPLSSPVPGSSPPPAPASHSLSNSPGNPCKACLPLAQLQAAIRFTEPPSCSELPTTAAAPLARLWLDLLASRPSHKASSAALPPFQPELRPVGRRRLSRASLSWASAYAPSLARMLFLPILYFSLVKFNPFFLASLNHPPSSHHILKNIALSLHLKPTAFCK